MSEQGPSSTRHRIQRKSLPETLAESLRERILDGEFKECEPLVQDAIARDYGVSRMPVREALRQLEAAGLVAIETHKGAIVTTIPTEQIAELFDLRALLECDLLSRAIPRATREHLATSQSVLMALEVAYEERDIASWGRLNWEFHRSLYVASDRVQTLAVLQGINVQIDRYIRLQLVLTEALDTAEKEHRELLRLCKARDAKRAVPYLEKHIRSAGRSLLAALRKSRAARAA